MDHPAVLVLLLASAGFAPPDAGACAAATGRVPYEPRSFLGFACARDCEAHKAGFAWAERHGIADPAACPRADPLQAEGCRAYAGAAVTAELAGFEWARENEIADPCLCRGAGPAFEAGCRAFVSSVGD